MYPPTVPPSRVRIAGKISFIEAVGITVSFSARPTGGRTIMITTKITTIMMPPRIFVSVSIAFSAFFIRKITIARPPAIKYPAISGMPSRVLKPRAPPPTFPMLNTRPPATTRNATT